MNNLNKTISLGEGNTPLIRLNNIEKLLNWGGEIWAKAEYQNPTGSFKDRGSIVEITEALTQKKSGVICASTGNMAASLSAYAAKNNLKCFVVVPKKTSQGKLKQAIICGANLIEVNSSYDTCVKKAIDLSKKNNLLLCGDYKLRRIGQKSLGKELAESTISFDSFIVPVGNGTLGCAIIEGFIEKKRLPKFIGVQGKGSDPIYQSWKKKRRVIKKIRNPKTIALAIKVGNPLDGKLTLDWIKKTNGKMISVSDRKILIAQDMLSKKEGIYVETSAASTLAGIIKIKNKISSLKVVLILTGSGLKEQ